MTGRVFDLSKPSDARLFIKKMTPTVLMGGTYVILSSSGKVELSNMTDDQAITVAHAVAELYEQARSAKH